MLAEHIGEQPWREVSLLAVGYLGICQQLPSVAGEVVETLAVARRRYGATVAADIIDRVLPAIEVTPVDAELHATALAAVRESIDSSVSLVDRTSFAFMRREALVMSGCSTPTPAENSLWPPPEPVAHPPSTR